MNYIIVEFSRYIILGALGLYLIESVWPLFYKKGDTDRGVYVRQLVYICLIHTLSMVTLYLVTDSDGYMRMYVLQIILLFAINRLYVMIYPRCSRMLVNHMCLLITIGFVELSRISYDKAFRQYFIVLAALIISLVIPYIIKKCPFIRNYTTVYGIVGIAMLTLVFTFGKSVNGSKLSYHLFGLTFQPSEFVKILFIFFVAGMLYENAKLPKLVVTAAISAVIVLLLALSKDLGSALLYYVVFIAMIFVATGKIRYSILGLGAGAAAAYFGYTMFPHVQTRIQIWLDPWMDIDNKGYQLTQSLFAIGTGGWMGMGLGHGQPSTIPFVDEDFMFSAICEEYGVIFGIFIILLYLVLFILLLKITLRTKDLYYRLILVGSFTLLAFQTFLTIGGGTRLIPLTGVTLPLISNGGSSAMSTIFLFGICIGISRLPRKKKADATQNLELDMADEISMSDEEVIAKKRKINAIILSVTNGILFIAIVGNLISYMLGEKEEAISNEYNIVRQEIVAAETIRGSILAADGTVLAETLVDAAGNERRYYPYDGEYAHIVGYSTFGNTGIEKSMNMNLIQSNVSFATRTSNGVAGKKNPGNVVTTTLVPELQDVAYSSLGMYKGAVIVTKVETGEILAMVSAPTFNPNTVMDDWDDLTKDTKNAALLNRASQGIYPPGSTFKIITTYEYMKENPDSYKNYYYTCSGSIKADDTVIHCFRHNVHGGENLYSSLGNSCNSSFANIGMKLDKTMFADTLMELMFNTDLPVQFEAKQSHVSMREYMSNAEMVQTAIGQGEVQMTPLHLNMITLAIANDGVMLTPYVISGVQSAEGEVIKTYGKQELGRVMSSEDAAQLREFLKYDVEHGTANRLSGQAYTAAGKTGSAEYQEKDDSSHALFTGYAPADNPQVCVTIILEGAGTGGDYCVPIAKRVFSKYFELYGMPY